ncbi:period circadian [Fusarium beomiforme]|uniref:Period circadian n=1 Tax=Fusarium beomiforme TaxID=44412 RepID=A0A9P5AQX3_9HYPO|nr:period circadian [Fusarium beomiforme]
MSGLINKVKDAIHSDKDKSHEQPEGTHGPHASRVANAADPRYDSDRDHRANPGTTTTGGLGSTHNTHTTGGMTGGSTYSENMPGHTTGRTENMPGQNTTGGLGHSSGLPEGTAGGLGSTHNTRTTGGVTGDSAYSETMPGQNTTGGLGNSSGLPEGTNKTGLGGSTGTYGQTTTGTSGLSSYGAGAHGPAGTTHQTGLGNTSSGYGTGPGPAPKTAGPHSSDMANKLDPRVDSDLDGSKTVGTEKTYQQSNNNFAQRDPTDAAQVPPSVLQKYVPSEIAHDDPHSDHARRHSSTHQETHKGL